MAGSTAEAARVIAGWLRPADRSAPGAATPGAASLPMRHPPDDMANVSAYQA